MTRSWFSCSGVSTTPPLGLATIFTIVDAAAAAIRVAADLRRAHTGPMRDATRQLTVAEQVGVWTVTVRPVRYLLQFLVGLPIIPTLTVVPHDGAEPWVVGPIVMLTVPYFADRWRRTDLTDAEERRVLTAQLTGWSTGDDRLDGWAIHRSEEAVEQRRGHARRDWFPVAFVAGIMTALAVVAAVLVSPWWLLCIAPTPLYLALPIARAQSDPAEVVRLLSSTPSDGHSP